MSKRDSKRAQEHPPKEHNYMRKLLYMYRVGAIPRSVGLHEISVAHDDWCALLAEKGRCNCSPIIKVAGVQHPGANN